METWTVSDEFTALPRGTFRYFDGTAIDGICEYAAFVWRTRKNEQEHAAHAYWATREVYAQPTVAS